MALQTTIPLLGSNADAKDLVITILSGSTALNARELFFVARNKFGSKLSYQAIHKGIMLLSQERVLTKTGSKYSISPEWLKQVKEFVENTGKTSKQNYVDELKPGQKETNLVFYSPIEAMYALLHLQYKEYLKKNPSHTISIMKRVWPAVCVDKQQFKEFEYVMTHSNHYTLVQGNSKVDEFMSKFFSDFGDKPVFGVKNCAKECDYLVFNDVVAKIFFPKTLITTLDKYYTRTKNIGQNGLNELYLIANNTRGETRIQIIRDQKLADELIQNTISTYNKKHRKEI